MEGIVKYERLSSISANDSICRTHAYTSKHPINEETPLRGFGRHDEWVSSESVIV
jgi:hypothetical protein